MRLGAEMGKVSQVLQPLRAAAVLQKGAITSRRGRASPLQWRHVATPAQQKGQAPRTRRMRAPGPGSRSSFRMSEDLALSSFTWQPSCWRRRYSAWTACSGTWFSSSLQSDSSPPRRLCPPKSMPLPAAAAALRQLGLPLQALLAGAGTHAGKPAAGSGRNQSR